MPARTTHHTLFTRALASAVGVMLVAVGSPAFADSASPVVEPSVVAEPVVSASPVVEPSSTPSASPVVEPSAGDVSAEVSAVAQEESVGDGVEPADDEDETTPAQPQSNGATAAVFSDVPDSSVFATEIAWLAEQGITNGWVMKDGTVQYRPLTPVTREAMAAFLYRWSNSPVTAVPAVSPFTDVSKSSNAFYVEISWMRTTGTSEGWTVASGVQYRPLSAITREAMAAFLYRLAGEPEFTTPKKLPFSDIKASPFAKEIAWLASIGVTKGWTMKDGTVEYRPTAYITREAMAAYLYRYSDVFDGDALASAGTTLRHTTLYVYGATTLNLRSGPGTGYAVVTTTTSGTGLKVTGVTQDGWVEVVVGGKRVWASSAYLMGRNGVIGSEIKSSYSNGKIPAKELCLLTWDRSETLDCAAAYDLELLNRSFREKFGYDIPINDSYRDYDTQVLYKEIYGNLAATPGTSNHGWGLAIDVSTTKLGGTSSAAYQWLYQRLGEYNWVHPTWARASGAKPEAWHFEYTG